jgi:hypothetical protein
MKAEKVLRSLSQLSQLSKQGIERECFAVFERRCMQIRVAFYRSLSTTCCTAYAELSNAVAALSS